MPCGGSCFANASLAAPPERTLDRFRLPAPPTRSVDRPLTGGYRSYIRAWPSGRTGRGVAIVRCSVTIWNWPQTALSFYSTFDLEHGLPEAAERHSLDPGFEPPLTATVA